MTVVHSEIRGSWIEPLARLAGVGDAGPPRWGLVPTGTEAGRADVPTVTRETILADMEREIEEAIERALMRLAELSDEQPASPSPDEPLQPPHG